MNRRRYASVGVALLALLLALALGPLAGTAQAGGVVLLMDEAPTHATAGERFQLAFRIISRHDSSVQSDLAPLVTLRHQVTGAEVTATARFERGVGLGAEAALACAACPAAGLGFKGSAGRYVATVSLPTAGTWDIAIQPYGQGGHDYPASVMTPIEVRAAPADLANAAASAAQTNPAPFAASPSRYLGWIAITTGALAGALALGQARRRQAGRP